MDFQVKDAFDNSVKEKLYKNVESKKGYTIKKAYALTNDREYFAELAKIYYLNNHYYPYSAIELKQYDPQGYELIQRSFIY